LVGPARLMLQIHSLQPCLPRWSPHVLYNACPPGSPIVLSNAQADWACRDKLSSSTPLVAPSSKFDSSPGKNDLVDYTNGTKLCVHGEPSQACTETSRSWTSRRSQQLERQKPPMLKRAGMVEFDDKAFTFVLRPEDVLTTPSIGRTRLKNHPEPKAHPVGGCLPRRNVAVADATGSTMEPQNDDGVNSHSASWQDEMQVGHGFTRSSTACAAASSSTLGEMQVGHGTGRMRSSATCAASSTSTGSLGEFIEHTAAAAARMQAAGAPVDPHMAHLFAHGCQPQMGAGRHCRSKRRAERAFAQPAHQGGCVAQLCDYSVPAPHVDGPSLGALAQSVESLPEISVSPTWHVSANSAGSISEDGHIFTKSHAGPQKKLKGTTLSSLCILFEHKLRVGGVHRYRYSILGGCVGSADGVGFVFDSKVRRTNIQRMRSIFLNQRGQVCMRNLDRIEKLPHFLPKLAVGVTISLTVDLNRLLARFEMEDLQGNHCATNKFSFASLIMGGALHSVSDMRRSVPSGFFCAIVTDNITVSLY